MPLTLREFIISWLDDLLVHHRTIGGLFETVRVLLTLCREFNIKLHPGKCVPFSTEIRGCGRIISAKGIRYDPRHLDGLVHMEPPSTGAHLQQFLCAVQWLNKGIPQFTDVVQPLQKYFQRVYERAEKIMKQAVSRVKLQNLGWGAPEVSAFESSKAALAKQVTLSHRDPLRRLCVYTDASDEVWSGIVTQVPYQDLDKPRKDQNHEPLAFLSSRFDSTQLGWATMEKEAFAVLATLGRMHWIVATPEGFDLYTDHNNLIFLFDPLFVVADLSQGTLRKVLRWAVKLSMYNYTCFHIKGLDNVWADLLGRWSAPRTVRRLVRIPALPTSSAPEFVWPSIQAIADIQSAAEQERPPHLTLVQNVWKNSSNAVWIPDSAADIQLRLCIIAHNGPAGHRGQSATEIAMRTSFFWSTMKSDIRAFVRACIHCISTVGGGKVPRPFGPAFHGSAPNDVLQFHYIDMGLAADGTKYILMLRDDHSDYKWFFAFADTSAQNAAQAIIDWCAAFGVPKSLISDGRRIFETKQLGASQRDSKQLIISRYRTLHGATVL